MYLSVSSGVKVVSPILFFIPEYDAHTSRLNVSQHCFIFCYLQITLLQTFIYFKQSCKQGRILFLIG